MTGNSSLGVLELTGKGSGFIRLRAAGYFSSDGDIHVGQKFVHQFGLRTGDEISGEVGEPPKRGKSPPLRKLMSVNGFDPKSVRHRPNFHDLTATHPKERLVLECGMERLGAPDPTNRVIDLLCPFGKGQRALIVAPAKAGKTMMLQAVAEGIVKNQPEAFLLILLVDERPEEITEMQMCGYGEVVACSFDFPPERHVYLARLMLERARRRVEMGQDVVIVLDSITRLARAHNKVGESSGRTLTGGLDATAMDQPKKFLGSARNIDPKLGGGSLTIIGTALIDTGSKMDQVIFEEFKGTGNSELVLSRELAERRIFPAIDLNSSATRREELLLDPETLNASRELRRRLASLPPVDAMSELLGYMRHTKTNNELVQRIVSE
ncbi:MAG: transcription termination factor Rho [Gemmatimonadales bacterium]